MSLAGSGSRKEGGQQGGKIFFPFLDKLDNLEEALKNINY